MSGPRAVPTLATVRASYTDEVETYDARTGDTPGMRALDAPYVAASRSADAVLEVGCGTGRLLRKLRAPLCVGVDPVREMLAVATPLPVVCGRGEALPFAAARFDLVAYGWTTFRYVDYPAAFAEAARVLRPGGRLMLHQFNRRTVPDPLHLGPLTELTAPASVAGLRLVDIRLWRPLRWPPYVVRLPRWAPWRHGVFTFARAADP